MYVCVCVCVVSTIMEAIALFFLLDKLQLFILTKHMLIIIRIIAYTCALHFSART